ncbi:flotillin domain-containing protein [Tothia fuscella]|uniref:Flotillin domain-containing protein n=1 Tax=Tothia fuscella TaxID=1048955 RepID=A0A9P4NEJ5_9PEZI|nr:flotillin domain-containing protein [Tothia fuscella]
MYQVADANEYLAITGLNIDTVVIKKKAYIFPFQKCSKFSVTPFDFSLALQAMTLEKLKFSLPAVFTIGPDCTDESLTKYATLLTGRGEASRGGAVAVGEGRTHVQDIVKGVIEGETRSIVSTMTMEELFKERRIFRDKVIKNVQSELDQFGLKIYNANVKELQDTAGSEYFAYLSRKAHEGALNQAKVDVADARMMGDVGEAERHGKTKQDIAKINAATAVLETERKAEKAQADAALADKEIHIEKELNLSRIIAKNAAEERDAELQKIVEQKRAEAQLERQRATTVTKAVIDRESAQEKAQAVLYTVEKEAAGSKAQQIAKADAHYYSVTKEAEANKISRQMEADAHYYTQKQEAEGLVEMSRAYGAMANVLGGPQGLMQYMMLQNNTYEKLANANAKAINGLNPKINVWDTGAGGGAGAMDPIKNLMTSLPPLLSTIHDQTGMQPPAWLMQMPNGEQNSAMVTKDSKMTNGTGK